MVQISSMVVLPLSIWTRNTGLGHDPVGNSAVLTDSAVDSFHARHRVNPLLRLLITNKRNKSLEWTTSGQKINHYFCQRLTAAITD